MKELTEYRVKLVARLGEAAREFCSVCEAGNPSAKVDEGEWTLHHVAAHTRDVDRLAYGARARLTLREENPLVKSFDPDTWEATYYDKDEPLPKILAEFSTSIEELCGMLEALPPEGWSRQSRHETIGGELTLQLWVERSLAHIEEHLQTLKNA